MHLAPGVRVALALFAVASQVIAAQAGPGAQPPSGPPLPPGGGGAGLLVGGEEEVALDHLTADQVAIAFGTQEVGQASAGVQVVLSNEFTQPLLVSSIDLVGADAGAFLLTVPHGAAFALRPGEQRALSVAFLPPAKGSFEADLVVTYGARGKVPVPTVELSGVGIGPVGAEVLLNVGGGAFLDSEGDTWCEEYGLTTWGVPKTSSDPVGGTEEDALYQAYREGPLIDLDLLLAPGFYEVTLHFLEPTHEAAGLRVMDVRSESEWQILGLDPYAAAGHDTAHSESFQVLVLDGSLDVFVSAAVGESVLSAIEVRSAPLLIANKISLPFGALGEGEKATEELVLTNIGAVPLTLDDMTFQLGGSGSSADFSLELGFAQYPGATSTVSHPLGITLSPLEYVAMNLSFQPSDDGYHAWALSFGGDFGDLDVSVSGLGGHEGHPFLHVVMDVPELVVDYDGDGLGDVLCDGMASHTHEPGHALAGYSWTEGGQQLATTSLALIQLPVGVHTLELEVTDDGQPPDSLSDTTQVEVAAVGAVPGVLTLYYEADAAGPVALLDAVPATADYAEVVQEMLIASTGAVGGSPFTGNVMVQQVCHVDLAVADTYDFVVSGGTDHRIEVDGVPWTGAAPLQAGAHALDVRWSVGNPGDLPLGVQLGQGGGPLGQIAAETLTHDAGAFAPVINDMPTVGSSLGGSVIDIEGLGFFPDPSVKLHWGAQVLDHGDFDELSADLIRFDSPPGTGVIQVRVETQQGFSNARSFEYDINAPVPIVFNTATSIVMPEPIQGAWGPDGRFYVAQRGGEIVAVTFDEHFGVPALDTYPGVSLLPNSTILGLAFDPWEAPGTVRVYVAHSELFAQGGYTFTGPAPYPGQISTLDGPSFDNPVPLVTGLPTSNHDHAINGMVFDDNGDLLVCTGGNTNAGVIHPNMGNLPESPLSAAILKVRLSDPAFSGVLSYVETATGAVNMDQVYGDLVDLAPGSGVEVHAPGMRNAFDMVYTTDGRLYATDNGPNFTYGDMSTGPTSQGPDPQEQDELLRVWRHVYYGHPNRNRGRHDERQNIYRGLGEPTIHGEFHQALLTLPSSSNGLTEYRSAAFGGQMRGDLLTQRWLSYMRRNSLSEDGDAVVVSTDLYPWTGALDLEVGPGGSLLGLDQMGGIVRVLVPSDQAAKGATVYDITPWRAPHTGGQRFTIAGVELGSLADTAVTLDGIPASLLSASPRRIVGVVPPHPAPPKELVDVVVTVAGVTHTLPGAFRYLRDKGTATGTWVPVDPMPLPLGEVAAGFLDGVVVVVGEGSPATLALDMLTGIWSSNLAVRQHTGNHHSAEVVDGLLYLIGGFGFGSEGKVQIYDPVSDTWSSGADMPWPGGSVSTCAIDGKIHAAGGIVGNLTVDNCAVYDPALDVWTPRAPMAGSKGRNHAAAATDGQRFFVFGGRGFGSGPGNWVANGFDDVQVYDPVTDTWEASFDPGSAIPPLPQSRGGMGKAVFYDGEFYVFGGETLNGAGATALNVYDRVDVYDPIARSWRQEEPMHTARHGISPVLLDSRIWVVGGGEVAGFSKSDLVAVFSRQ